MAGLKRCLGVDLGNTKIKVAELQFDRGRPRVVRLLSADVDIPPGTDDEERALRMSRALRDLLRANKVTTKDAVFSIPGRAVFQKPIRLPRTSPERLKRIIEFEARQQIPFPLEQTRFEYQIFDDPDNPEEVEVLLAAVKRENVQAFTRLFARTGLRVAGIGVSFFALFNFHQLLSTGGITEESDSGSQQKKGGGLLSFGKKKKGQPEGEPETEDALPEMDESEEMDEDELADADIGFEEIKAYVNLGATSMDLSIPNQGGREPGFCRTIPHAGNELTRAIQKALTLESFREAEDVKRNQAIVLAAETELEEPDRKHNKQASEALTKVVDRYVVSELRRSLDFYISQPGGVAADALVLSGGQSRQPWLASYIEEKLGLTVETLDSEDRAPKNGKLGALELADGLNAAEWSDMDLAIGLAAQGLEASVIHIDFLPEERQVERRFVRRMPEVAAMVVVLIVMIVLSMGVGSDVANAYRQRAQELRSRFDPNAAAQLQQLKQMESQRQAIISNFEKMARAIPDRDFWLDFLAEVLVEKPPEAVINSMVLQTDGLVQIQGECDIEGPITDFYENLRQRTDIVRDVQIISLSDPVSDENQRWRAGKIYQFTFGMNAYQKHTVTQTKPPQ